MQVDNTSFRSIYETYYNSIYKFLGLYTRDTTQIEDVIQDVFVKLWEDRDKLEISFLKTYLFHSAKNRMLNCLRNEHQRINLLEAWFDEQTFHASDKDCFDIDDFYKKAQQAIDALPPKCKELFLLSRNKKMTYKQIADFKSISVNTVENQMGIALKKIREFVSKHPFILFLYFFQ